MSTLEVILDLMEQIKVIRYLNPEVAGHLERDIESLLGGMGFMSVQEVAVELGVTKPTVQNWLATGYLSGEQTSKQTLIEVGSVIQLIPVIREARSKGIAYPANAIREWFKEMQAVTVADRTQVDERRERLLSHKLKDTEAIVGDNVVSDFHRQKQECHEG